MGNQKSTMPRGGRARPPAPAPAAPAPAPAPVAHAAPAPAASHVPAVAPAPPPMMAQPQQPSMMQQMAVTAGGVAIGNVAGTALTNAIFGSSNDSTPAAQAAPAVPAPVAPAPVPQQQPCALELQDFIKCTQTQSDVTLCSGFNEILKECKQKAQM